MFLLIFCTSFYASLLIASVIYASAITRSQKKEEEEIFVSLDGTWRHMTIVNEYLDQTIDVSMFIYPEKKKQPKRAYLWKHYDFRKNEYPDFWVMMHVADEPIFIDVPGGERALIIPPQYTQEKITKVLICRDCIDRIAPEVLAHLFGYE